MTSFARHERTETTPHDNTPALRKKDVGQPQAARVAVADLVVDRRLSPALAGQLESAVQLIRSATARHDARAREAAQAGTLGAASPLPHRDAIETSFGGHDLSDVKAYVGGPAREACAAMGAEAFATGNAVAFESSPDVQTAAHEAAHVVQQRAGRVAAPAQASGSPINADMQLEAEADRAGESAARGEPASLPPVGYGATPAPGDAGPGRSNRRFAGGSGC